MRKHVSRHFRRLIVLTATMALGLLPGSCANDILRLATPFLI